VGQVSVKPYYQKLLDPRWQRVKSEVQQRDNFTCRDCSATDRTLHVHHVHYFKGDPWDTPTEFLLTLCDECHEERGSLESDIKMEFARILVQLDQSQLISLMSDMLVAQKSDVVNGISLLANSDLEWLASARLHRAAWTHPEFRACYSYVTGTEPAWGMA